MDYSPKVSVIVPNYNHAIYLQQRIESVLQQSFNDFELILLDDCSTDHSRDILSCYHMNPKVSHVLFNDQNTGNTFMQWSKGLSLARGKYIWIAESDDYADPDFLKCTVSELEKNSNAVVVFTGSQMVDEKNRSINMDWDHFSSRQSLQTIYNGKEFVQKRMILNNSVYNASMVVFKRVCYAKVSERYKEFRYCGDWMFWSEICMQGDVISINQKLNYFRQHLCKVSVNAVKEGLHFKEGCIVMQYLISKLQLSFYEKLVISGRVQKRLLDKMSGGKFFRRQIIETNRSLFVGGRFSILIYELNKVFKLFCVN